MRSDLFCAVLYDPLCVLCSLSAYLAAFAAIIVLGQGGAYGMDASHTMEMYVVMGLLTALAFFRHRANIMRLAKGTENRVYLGKKDKK